MLNTCAVGTSQWVKSGPWKMLLCAKLKTAPRIRKSVLRKTISDSKLCMGEWRILENAFY